MTQDLLTIIIRCCDTEYFLVDILPGPHTCFTISTELLLAKNTVKNNKILEPERISRGYAVKTFAQSLRHLGNVFLYSFKRRKQCELYKIPVVNSRFPGNGFENNAKDLQWEVRKVNDFISDSKIESLFLSLPKSPNPFKRKENSSVCHSWSVLRLPECLFRFWMFYWMRLIINKYSKKKIRFVWAVP